MKLAKENWNYFVGNDYEPADMPLAVLYNVLERYDEFFSSFVDRVTAEMDYRIALINRVEIEQKNPRRAQTVIGGWNGTVVQAWEYEDD